MRALGLSVVVALIAFGCGLDSGDDNGGPRSMRPVVGTACASLDANAVECGLLQQGLHAPCHEPETQRDECQLGCFTSGGCSDIRALVCTDIQQGPVLDCMNACRNQPFVCDSGDLVSSNADCDGIIDCQDASDELGCGGVFVCVGGAEISGRGVCDGFAECPDGDDEAGCFFDCGDGTTFPRDFRCDGSDDCANASDETGCLLQPDPICN